MSEHGPGPTVRLYLIVFVALLVLLGVTYWAATFELGAWNVPVALLIASVKTALVILYFMHVRWSERIIPVLVLASFLFLGLLMVMTIGDLFSRG